MHLSLLIYFIILFNEFNISVDTIFVSYEKPKSIECFILLL
jgi:hypothetical protein